MVNSTVAALLAEPAEHDVLVSQYFYVDAPARDGSVVRTRTGGVFLHEPTAAILLPSDFPPLSRRRPEFAALRHVLIRFSFMLDRLPPRHNYESATLAITLDNPDAVVRVQRPAWVAADTELSDTITTEFSAALEGLARLGARRTRVKGAVYQGRESPVVTAEKRDRGSFGWRYEAQEGAPLVSRVEFAVAVIELPRAVTELSGRISCEAVIVAPRYGVFKASRALPAEPPAPFRLWLGDAF
jgi:hypothetical protein